MKELIQIIVVAILIVVSLLFVINTRGSGNLDWSVDLSALNTEETFSYDIVNDSLNGEYKNNKGNSMYAMVGKNSDGTYRVYFIHVGASAFGKDNRYVQLRLDSVLLDANGSYAFTTENNVPLKLTLKSGQLVVSSNMGLGDSSMEGIYIYRKGIARFTMNEFQIYKN